MRTLKNGQQITNSKGISYYKANKKYFKSTGWMVCEISKEEFDVEIEKAFAELQED